MREKKELFDHVGFDHWIDFPFIDRLEMFWKVDAEVEKIANTEMVYP